MKTKLLYYTVNFLSGYGGKPDIPSSGNHNLDNSINSMWNLGFALAIAAAAFGILMTGAMFIFPSKRDKAKDNLPYVVIGSLVVMGVGGILMFLSQFQIL